MTNNLQRRLVKLEQEAGRDNEIEVFWLNMTRAHDGKGNVWPGKMPMAQSFEYLHSLNTISENTLTFVPEEDESFDQFNSRVAKILSRQGLKKSAVLTAHFNVPEGIIDTRELS